VDDQQYQQAPQHFSSYSDSAAVAAVLSRRGWLFHMLPTRVSTLIDPDATVEIKLQKAKKMEPFLQEIDGYLSFSSEKSFEGQWPVLVGNIHFRK
jgi:hypothetical protein